eukprot:6472042-Amphidinium_carterae.1
MHIATLASGGLLRHADCGTGSLISADDWSLAKRTSLITLIADTPQVPFLVDLATSTRMLGQVCDLNPMVGVLARAWNEASEAVQMRSVYRGAVGKSGITAANEPVLQPVLRIATQHSSGTYNCCPFRSCHSAFFKSPVHLLEQQDWQDRSSTELCSCRTDSTSHRRTSCGSVGRGVPPHEVWSAHAQ